MTYMPKLGAAVRTFASEAEGMGNTTIVKDSKALSKAVGAIADVLTYISSDDINIEERDGFFTQLIKGENETDSLISYVGTLGTEVSTMAGEIRGISEGTIVADVETAKDAIERLVTLLTDLQQSAILSVSETSDSNSGLEAVKTKFGSLMTMIADLGVAIATFDNDTADVDLEDFKAFVATLDGVNFPDMSGLSDAIESMKSLFSGSGSEAITTENFLKGLDINKISEKLGAFTSGLGDVISSNTETMSEYTGSFNDAGSSLMSAVNSGMSEGADTSAVSNLCSKMVSTLSGSVHLFRTAGSNFGIGLGNGISNTAVFVKTKAAYVAKQAVAAVKTAFDEHSPSKVAMGLGSFFSEGLGIGIEDNAGSAIRSSENMAESIIGNARNGLNMLSAIIEDNMDVDPVVRPVMDLSEVKSGAKSINNMIPGRATVLASTSLSNASTTANSIAKRNAHQNGNGQTTFGIGNNVTEDNAVNLSGNNFYIRSENDIHLLASEIASLTRSQQRSLGGVF